MNATGRQVEQVREALAARRAPTGRRRAEFAVTARWLRSLRTRADGPRGGSARRAG
jgi:hypothetical protein